MNKIYKIVADCRKDFIEMSYAFTTDENEINEVVQELMLYFLQMNKDTLKNIYDKDGKQGILRYGAVALRRSFNSPRSQYYYKYKKYYTKLDDTCNITTSVNYKLENIPVIEIPKSYQKLEQIDTALDDMYWYDREIFKLYYYEKNTLDSLAEKTGISRNSLYTTIDKVRKELIELFNE